jgi:predicted transglutaminase-like protease
MSISFVFTFMSISLIQNVLVIRFMALHLSVQNMQSWKNEHLVSPLTNISELKFKMAMLQDSWCYTYLFKTIYLEQKKLFVIPFVYSRMHEFQTLAGKRNKWR